MVATRLHWLNMDFEFLLWSFNFLPFVVAKLGYTNVLDSGSVTSSSWDSVQFKATCWMHFWFSVPTFDSVGQDFSVPVLSLCVIEAFNNLFLSVARRFNEKKKLIS